MCIHVSMCMCVNAYFICIHVDKNMYACIYVYTQHVQCMYIFWNTPHGCQLHPQTETEAMTHGRVVIVTNAADGWIETSCAAFMPGCSASSNYSLFFLPRLFAESLTPFCAFHRQPLYT